jgi:hypothetical protein
VQPPLSAADASEAKEHPIKHYFVKWLGIPGKKSAPISPWPEW